MGHRVKGERRGSSLDLLAIEGADDVAKHEAAALIPPGAMDACQPGRRPVTSIQHQDTLNALLQLHRQRADECSVQGKDGWFHAAITSKWPDTPKAALFTYTEPSVGRLSINYSLSSALHSSRMQHTCSTD